MNKKFFTILTAVTLMFSVGALAQDDSGGESQTDTTTESPMQMQMTDPMSMGTFEMALGDLEAQTQALSSLSDLTPEDVLLVSVAELHAGMGADMSAEAETSTETEEAETSTETEASTEAEASQPVDVQALITENQAQIDSLRQALMSNTAIQEALTQAGITAEQVVAIYVMSDAMGATDEAAASDTAETETSDTETAETDTETAETEASDSQMAATPKVIVYYQVAAESP